MFPNLFDSFRSTSASLANLYGSFLDTFWHDSPIMTEDWLDYWKEQDTYLLTDYQLAM